MLTELCVAVISQTTIHFRDGENVTLICHLNHPVGIVLWKKDNTIITDEKYDISPTISCCKKYSVLSNDSFTAMLKINMADDCVVGNYGCETRGDQGFQSFSVKLSKIGV